MALTHVNKWINDHIHMLSFAHCSSLREAVKADIKESRPTVRRKPPVQQPQPETCPLCGSKLLISKLDLLVCSSNDCVYMYDVVKHRAVR